jgi:1-acyl-sn-glycerol-3-phosphate acyltransferase
VINFLIRHTVVRRMCSVTFLALVCVAVLVLLPLAGIAGCIDVLTCRVRGGRRGRAAAARFATFAGAYLVAEIAGLCGMLLLRLRRDSGEDAAYALLTRLLSLLFRTATFAFALRVSPPEQPLELPDGPLLVFSRHAGPGDSFLLMYALLTVANRRPRVVLKDTLSFDPMIDVLLSRMPHCYVGRDENGRAEAAEHIGELAASLDDGDALLLFPEGRNFTTARRKRLISRLRRQRKWRDLPTAEALDHVLPARPTGVFAAVDAAPPRSEIVFVAHTGLDRLQTLADTWRAVPLDRPVQLIWWAVPVTQVPAADEARLTWLKEQWTRVDTWLDDHDEITPR